MDVSQVRRIREDMERAEARRLQPHFVASFFLEAFKHLGGTIHEREPKRYEVKHVPAVIRNRDRLIGRGEPVLPRYERITFEKNLISIPGKPLAKFVCPGHPLLDATIDLIQERYRDLLRRGAILVDDAKPGSHLRALLYLEHSIQDARTDRAGNRRIVSRRCQFVEIDQEGKSTSAGWAPYLDYRPLTPEEQSALHTNPKRQRGPTDDNSPESMPGTSLTADSSSLADSSSVVDSSSLALRVGMRSDLEAKALEHAAIHLVPEHLNEIRRHKEELIDKTIAAVKDRLTKEITYWTTVPPSSRSRSWPAG